MNNVVVYGIIIYVKFISLGTYLGYYIEIAPEIDYHYGTNNKQELKNLFKKCLILITITSIGMILLAEILSRMLASIFVSYDAELLNMTITTIRLFAISYLIERINILLIIFYGHK